MASVGENLRTFLVNSTALSGSTHFDNIAGPGVIEQSTLRQNAPAPRIWFQRSGQEEPPDLSGDGGLAESTWDIEIHSEQIDQPLAIAELLKRRLNGYYGAFGTQRVQGIFVEDHDDDYEPLGVASEEGLYVAAIAARIIFATT